MRIKNLVPKVIGIGGVDILPSKEWQEVDDSLCYAPVFDKYGNRTGKEEVLPSLTALEKAGLIAFVETREQEPEKKQKVKQEPEEKQEPGEDAAGEQSAKKTGRKKK